MGIVCRGGESLLADAIETFMNEIGEGYGDDPLRLFYRTKVRF